MRDDLMQAHLARELRPVGVLDRLRVLLTGPGSIWWVMVLTLLASAWAFGGTAAWVEYVRFNTEGTGVVPGTVIDADDTNVEINERTVSWVTYDYEVGGERRESVSFGSEYYPRSGSTVRVEYLLAEPHWTRIPGRTRSAMNGPLVLVLVGLALLAVPVATWRSLKAWRWLALLRAGRPGRAVLVDKRPTSTTVNDQPVYELHFVYTGEDGAERSFTTKRWQFDDITDDDDEVVLYDGRGNVLFMDELPVPMAPARGGGWQHVGAGTVLGAALKRLALPVVILGVGALF